MTFHLLLGAEVLKNAAAFSTTVNQATAAFVPYLDINCILCYVICLQRTEKKILFI